MNRKKDSSTGALSGVPVYRIEMVREREVSGELGSIVRNSAEVARLVRPVFAGLDREQFAVLLLDARHRPIGVNVVSVGSLTASVTHPREVFKPAILASAAAVILVHNHPSGEPSPSPEDVEITRRLKQVGDVVGIRVLDSVILGEETHFSFTDSGTS